MSGELEEALHGQPGITQAALTQEFVGNARVVRSLGQEFDIETQSCRLHLTIEAPWGPARFTMPFIVLSMAGDVVIIGQKTLRGKIGIDVIEQLTAFVLNACGRQNGAGMELTARAVGELKAGAVLVAEMAVTALGPGGDAPGDVNNNVTVMLPSQRPMIFQDSKVEMRGSVGVLETAINNAVDHAFPSECAKMLRHIVLCTHLDVFRRAGLGGPPARVEPMAVRLHPRARVVRVNPPPKRDRLR